MEGESTYLTLEWTNQHGCGGNEDTDPHKLNCNIVLQYMVIDYDSELCVCVWEGGEGGVWGR